MRDRLRALTGADRAAIAVGVVAAVAGAVVIALASDTTASIVGACLLGIAGIAFVSLAFLLVGESEDREREDDAP
jgi:MFS family permease